MENIEKSRRKKFPVAQTILHVVLVFLLFIMLYPLAMALWNAFKSDIAYDYTRWYPTLPLRIRNVSTAFDMTSKYMLNTVVVGVAGTAGMLAISSLASFAFAKMKFPGRSFFLSMVLALMMVPGVLTLVPSYILYKTLGLHDNLMALILPIWTGGCIFAVFLLTTFFSGLPKDLFEAAQIDGANPWQALVRIKLPMVMSSVTICLFLSLTNSFKLFDQNLSLTGGEPNHASEMLALNIYNTFYTRSGPQWKGIGQAKAVIFFVLVVAIALVQLRATRSREVQQ